MVNGLYGRALPRFVMAVATYRAQFGSWPSHAHGRGVMALVTPPTVSSDADDHVEYRQDLADLIQSRLSCDDDGEWIEVSGAAGRCSYEIDLKHPLVAEADAWLFGGLRALGKPAAPMAVKPSLATRLWVRYWRWQYFRHHDPTRRWNR